MRLAMPVLAAGLAGCATFAPAPPLAPMRVVTLPDSWSGTVTPAPDAPVLAAWWRGWRDPQLDALIAHALENNTSVAAAAGALAQARALRDAARAGLAPSATLSLNASRGRASGGARSGNASLSADLAWEPDWAGERRSTLRAAQAEAQAGQYALAQARAALAAEVSLAYLDLRAAQTRLAIARDNLDNQCQTAQLTHWRTLAGLASSLDDEQARASAEQAAARIAPLESAIAQAGHVLAVLGGAAPGPLPAALAAPAPLPQAALPVLGVPADAVRRRPDVLAAGQRLQAALARVDAAEAARLPSLRLDGTLSARGWDVTDAPRSVVRSLVASLGAPLFDAGAGLAQVQAQQGALLQARASYEAALLGALQDVEDELAALAAGQARLQHLDAALEAAANAALLARQRYASGLVDFQVVLETQRNLFTVQDDAAVTRAALAADQARLYRALGGGWAGPDASEDNER